MPQSFQSSHETSGICSSCDTGYFLNSATNACYPCSGVCETCTSQYVCE